MNVAGLCLSALLMAHLTSTFPVDTGTNSGTRLELQELLDRLESLTEHRAEEVLVPQRDQSVPGSQRAEEVYARAPQRTDDVPEELADSELTQDQLDEVLIRELLSAKNLRAVRNNSNRNSSGCFGRRMDRIGSMTSLGCNTGVRNSAKSA